MTYNVKNKYCNDMKEKIREILIKHSDNKKANDRIEAELLNLFSVSDMFSFAKYLKENYDYHDNTEEGDIYIHKGNKLKYTEYKIYLTWSNYR